MKLIITKAVGFSLVALTAALTTISANAACTPDPAASGGTVTCSTSDTDGFHATSDGIRIDVLDGASVSNGANNAIDLLDDNGLLNKGTITALSGTGIAGGNSNQMYLDFDTGYSGITNIGEINASVGISVGINNSVENVGEINASQVGIIAGELNSVTNAGAITVGEGGEGILVTGVGTSIRNSGVIDSEGDGVVLAAGSSLNNSGRINAIDSAVRVSEGLEQFGRQVSISNSGVIVGNILGSDTSDSVTNVGLIEGDIFLGAGNDDITLAQPSVTKGHIDGGADGDAITSSQSVAFEGRITNIEVLLVSPDSNLIMNLTEASVIDRSTVSGTLLLDGTLTGDMIVNDIGALSGAATLNGNLTNDGLVAMGNSIGILSVSGTYTQSETGSLFVKLGSNSADTLAVGAAANLNGNLRTGLQGDDFAGVVGKSYTVLTASSVNGTLATTGQQQHGFWTVNVEQTGNAVNVTVTDVTVPLGAMNTSRDVLAAALAAATPFPPGGGIVVEGGSSTLPIFGGIHATNETLPVDPGSISGLGDDEGQEAMSLRYDSMGDWESAAAAHVGSLNTLGPRTPAGAMPKTGSGTFEGTTRGELTETASPEAFVVEGDVLLTADFASGLVNADFTGMEKIDSRGVTSAWVDFRARMSIADGTSEFAGTAGSEDGVWNGEAKGGFFGDEGGMPGHAAGLWSMSSALGRALGGFTAKRQ
ncbi:hypothetical protein [Iodidimonas sp. SYSU 1G8]|uniref:hypothetical protein n=1 Tax=Iodidimonas sp. SYSU 1G8 TaxID=3133967 RepID=UPI0031FF192A